MTSGKVTQVTENSIKFPYIASKEKNIDNSVTTVTKVTNNTFSVDYSTKKPSGGDDLSVGGTETIPRLPKINIRYHLREFKGNK